MSLKVGLKIRISSSGLTKLCTFTPLYVLLNATEVKINCAEWPKQEKWIEIGPNSVSVVKYFGVWSIILVHYVETNSYFKTFSIWVDNVKARLSFVKSCLFMTLLFL